MAIQIKTAIDFFNLGREAIRRARNEVIISMAKDATENIKVESGGQFDPKINYYSGKAVVGVYTTPDDPEGVKVLKIEDSTKAFEKAFKRLMDKSRVVSILNGEVE